MIRLDNVQVLTPQITPIEARFLVTVTWKAVEQPESGLLRLGGTVAGPLCEYAETLHSRVELKQTAAHVGHFSEPTHLMAAARILEPCFWEPAHPFCYELVLELHSDHRLLDMRRIISGIRHFSVKRNSLLLNGQDYFVQGVSHSPSCSITELQEWHELECSAFLTAAKPELCERTDRFGPMVLHCLPPTLAEATTQVLQLRNHPSLLLWVVPAEVSRADRREFVKAIRSHDPSRPIAESVAIDESVSGASLADLLFLPASHPHVGNPKTTQPYFVVSRFAGYTNDCTPGNFTERIGEFHQSLGEQPGLVGVIV